MMIGTVNLQSGTAPLFGLLHDIIIYGEAPTVLFVFTLLETLGYSSALGAYAVLQLLKYRCIYRSSIICPHLFNMVHHSNHTAQYIKSKYDLSVYCSY